MAKVQETLNAMDELLWRRKAMLRIAINMVLALCVLQAIAIVFSDQVSPQVERWLAAGQLIVIASGLICAWLTAHKLNPPSATASKDAP